MAVLAALVMVGALALALVGCGDNGDQTSPGGPETVSYSGYAGTVKYTLKITEETAHYAAQIGDSYELSRSSDAKKSTGTVSGIGGTLTLKPSADEEELFFITVLGTYITAMSGTISWDGSGGTEPAPAALTSSPPGEPPPPGSLSFTMASTMGGFQDESTWVNAVTYGKGLFVIAGEREGAKAPGSSNVYYDAHIAWSTDGKNWTGVPVSGDDGLKGVTYGDYDTGSGIGRFVAVSWFRTKPTDGEPDSYDGIYYSDDGKTWNIANLPEDD